MEIRTDNDSQSNCPKEKNREDYNKILAGKNPLSFNPPEWIKESLYAKYY